MNTLINLCYYITATWGILALIHFIWIILVKDKTVEDALVLTHKRFNKL